MTCGLVCKSWHADAAETLLRDTAASGRGARRFFLKTENDEDAARARADRASARAEASDDRASLRARRESGSAVSEAGGSEVDGGEEFSSKRRRVEPFAGPAGAPPRGGDAAGASRLPAARDDSSVGAQGELATDVR